jgi:hypothetical protein
MAAQMSYPNGTDLAAQVSAEDVKQILANVFKSKQFVHAPKKQKFIQLICRYYLNGQAAELNEYLIGRDVFDRDDSYNPAADPIVRVGAHDIRKKLELYYQNEGASDEIRLVMPLGSYEPVFVRQTLSPPVHATKFAAASGDVQADDTKPRELEANVISNVPDRSKTWHWVLGGLTVIFFLASLVLLGFNRRLQQQLEQLLVGQVKDLNSSGAVWEPFLNDTAPTIIILSNPTVYRSANESDPEIVVKKGIPLSPEQARELTNITGNRLPVMSAQTMRLVPASNMYTGIGEAVGAYRLAGLLQSSGEKTILKQSRNIGPEDLKQSDVILLGSVYSNQWSKPLSIHENFVYTKHGTIENLNPRPDEQREYRPVFDPSSSLLVEDYALISVTPGVAGDHTIMVLAGLYSEGTQAAAEFVTTNHSLQELNQRLQQVADKAGASRYYQAMLKVRVENAFPTKATLIAFRELKVSNQ